MRGQPDLFGEIHGDEEDEILNIAWEAAEKRQQATEKTNKQMMLDGTMPVCRGYVVYSDFNELMRRKMGEPQTAPADISHAQKRIEIAIKEILEACEWEHEPGRGRQKARFYTPSTE